MNYRLSPSDLTFLYDGCKHCFVLKVKHGVSQPSIPLPGIFSKIGSLQKEYYSGKRTEAIYSGLPRGVVTYGERQVRSRTIEFSCSVVCRSRPDKGPSAAEVLDPPIVAVVATGTVVVP